MKKKALALLLSAAMVMTAAGCGNQEGDPSSSGAGNSSGSNESGSVSGGQESEGEPSEQEPEEPSYDFGGRTVRIGSYYDMTPKADGDLISQAFAKRIAYVEENYNCNIEFVVVSDNSQTLAEVYATSVLSGAPCCDVGYTLSYRLLPALIEGGIAQPISDLGVVDYSDPWYDDAATEAGTYKGKQYTMGMRGAGVQYGIFWNKTLFDRYGLPDLYDLYEKGEWTWEKFKEIALAGNQDLDGDGEYDVHGFNQRENLVWSFMTSNGADAVKKTDAGIELALETPEALEALEFYADFMQNVPHLKGWLGDWQSQIWDFRDGNSCMCYEAWWISGNYLTEMEDEWGFVPFPMGPSGTEYVSYGKEASPYMMLNGIENPEEVAQIIDLIFQIFEDEDEWEDAIMAAFEANATDAKAVDVCLELSQKNKISPLMGFGDLNDMINNMLNTLSNGENTPQTALEANRSALEAAVADIQNHDYKADMQEYLNPPEEEEGEGE